VEAVAVEGGDEARLVHVEVEEVDEEGRRLCVCVCVCVCVFVCVLGEW
jgi:hypothetical protein